jgi:peptidoglycan/xylan/chitin deacetylase (PgdA/CDA1 family)
MSSLDARSLARTAAWRLGALQTIHRARNASSLTVVTFHRVLAAGDPRWQTADPRYTIERAQFAACLAFFRRHYRVVSPDQVLAALEDTPLPDRSLLVTIDDGWADTYDDALPELQRAGIGAVVFVTADAIDAVAPFWPERVVAAALAGTLAGGQDAATAIVERLGRETPAERERWLADSLPPLDPRSAPRLGTATELRALFDAGMAIGGHGATHAPLAGHPDLVSELEDSRESLQRALGPLGDGEPAMVSFPHGSYDRAAVVAARAAGFRLLGTNDPCLNQLTDGLLTSDLVGRIGIPASVVVDRRGRVRDDLLARWLWRRPRRVVSTP